mmetsp:Transcript_43285/g.113896  ORF Transcript_43285/g.113896 Transcript_43285/m.113896 type:complete len:223 (+) Transcript_43285:1137-1805(+)
MLTLITTAVATGLLFIIYLLLIYTRIVLQRTDVAADACCLSGLRRRRGVHQRARRGGRLHLRKRAVESLSSASASEPGWRRNWVVGRHKLWITREAHGLRAHARRWAECRRGGLTRAARFAKEAGRSYLRWHTPRRKATCWTTEIGESLQREHEHAFVRWQRGGQIRCHTWRGQAWRLETRRWHAILRTGLQARCFRNSKRSVCALSGVPKALDGRHHVWER